MCLRLVRHRDGQAGFTLLELVVVIGAIAVVMAVLTIGIRRASDAFSLRRAASIVTSELRRANAGAVSAAIDYVVEFVTANPGSVKVYRSTATAQTCPSGYLPKPPTTTTLCTRTVSGQDWPASVAITSSGTTFGACAAPASPSNKCVTFKPLGYAVTAGTCGPPACLVQLRSRSGVILNVEVALTTGRVGIRP